MNYICKLFTYGNSKCGCYLSDETDKFFLPLQNLQQIFLFFFSQMFVVDSEQFQLIFSSNFKGQILKECGIFEAFVFIEWGGDGFFQVFDGCVFEDLYIFLVHGYFETAIKGTLKEWFHIKHNRMTCIFVFDVNSGILVVYLQTLVRKIFKLINQLLVLQ